MKYSFLGELDCFIHIHVVAVFGVQYAVRMGRARSNGENVPTQPFSVAVEVIYLVPLFLFVTTKSLMR